MVESTGGIEALLQEDRTFPPPESFASNANIKDPSVYEEASKDPEAFWARFAVILTGLNRGSRCSTGNPLTPSGLLAASLTPPNTVSTGT